MGSGTEADWIFRGRVLRWLHCTDAAMMPALALLTLGCTPTTVTYMSFPQTSVALSSSLQDFFAFTNVCNGLAVV